MAEFPSVPDYGVDAAIIVDDVLTIADARGDGADAHAKAVAHAKAFLQLAWQAGYITGMLARPADAPGIAPNDGAVVEALDTAEAAHG